MVGLCAVGGALQPLAGAHVLELAASPLPIQSVSSLVLAIDFPKQALKPPNLCLCDIRPDDEGREMSPQIPFTLAVGMSL
jgi:hypothetical protein